MDEIDFKRLLDESAAETQRRIDASAAETQRHFDETTERLAKDMRTHFDTVAEGMDHKIGLIAERVIMVDERLTREAIDIRSKMDQGFAETQAMIKFSHAELDRRIHAVEEKSRTLEESVHRLQARMDRLEAMTATQ